MKHELTTAEIQRHEADELARAAHLKLMNRERPRIELPYRPKDADKQLELDFKYGV